MMSRAFPPVATATDFPKKKIAELSTADAEQKVASAERVAGCCQSVTVNFTTTSHVRGQFKR
jgi:hypothetical protein